MDTIHIQVSPEILPSLTGKKPASTDSDALLDTVEELGVELEPMHRGAKEQSLAVWFKIEVVDSEKTQMIIDRLLGCPGVTGAYLESPPEPSTP